MERQHGLNNQQQSLFRGHPNMNGYEVNPESWTQLRGSNEA